MCYSVWDGAYKEPLLFIGKSSPCSGDSGFAISLSGPIPYVRCHIAVNKMC